ncbi:XdhC family protein [Halalkalibacterium halodurans]|uniref:XdhC family protein n=1 Tax=Halalkalibacterium halodurans TaxID=86665 RepID=UPI002E1A6CA3|nr:XdhC family protein [Halalkalibacterium halodurans]MED4084560.1 XdhC family protein [Halalkalibacterium halodurans]MED4104876.1 XdhC family protein [Halalkalibacterium halodurans]MED4109683.1 XdhC family protein [Halalkalibacterium halodurans]MED4122919.1 XdhC family protein [Halalkalibacterium halodurans]
MKRFERFLRIMKQTPGQRYALATIIHVEGSAYRKAGARMMFSEDDIRYGTISAGCLEEDLSYWAKDVIRSNRSFIKRYDLRSEDDAGWGEGAGCNGKIDVFLEPICWQEESFSYQPILAALSGGKKIASVRGVGQYADGMKLFITEDGDELGQTGMKPSILAHHVKIQLNRLFTEKRPIHYEAMPELESGFVFERYESRDILYLFGAGPDVEPVVTLADQMEFHTIIIDPRSERCSRTYFPRAGGFIVEQPETIFRTQTIRPDHYVLIMTHSFQKDRKLLHYFLDHPPAYLGILGSKSRANRLAAPKQLPDWVHSPVGLAIGAEGAEEISISIMAQLIQARVKRRTFSKEKHSLL